MKTGKISAFGVLTSYGKWYSAEALYQINRLYYVHGGRAVYTEHGERRTLLPGHVYFIPAAEGFAPVQEAGEPFVHSYADFSLISPIKCERVMTVPLEADEKLSLALRLFLIGCEKKSAFNVGRSSCDDGFFSLFEAAISYIVTRIVNENGADYVSDGVVTRAISEMNSRMNENITVRDIADAVYMSEDGFIRRFSRVMGVTPYAYLKKLRLAAAESMLNDGAAVSDIAQAVGYSDPSSLLHAISVERRRNGVK